MSKRDTNRSEHITKPKRDVAGTAMSDCQNGRPGWWWVVPGAAVRPGSPRECMGNGTPPVCRGKVSFTRVLHSSQVPSTSMLVSRSAHPKPQPTEKDLILPRRLRKGKWTSSHMSGCYPWRLGMLTIHSLRDKTPPRAL